MAIYAIIFGAILAYLIYRLFDASYNNLDFILGVLFVIGLVWFSLKYMKGMYVGISRDFDIETQDCVGWVVEEGKCLGIVRSY